MGCGTSAKTAISPTRGDEQGTSVKADIILEKKTGFSENYSLEKSLGFGTYAEVWSAKNIKTGDPRAIKIVKKSLSKKYPELPSMLRSEIETLRKMDSPSLMKLYETYEDDYKIYFIVEFMQGPALMDYIKKQPASQFTEKRVAGMLRQMLVGLNHCHTNNMVHRDIKLENIMFADTACTQLKLIDFGFAKMFDPMNRKFQEILGSPMYMAPEICSKKAYDTKCDIWSMGIVTFILMSAEIPYDILPTDTLPTLMSQIKSKTFTKADMQKNRWKCISDQGKEFVLAMLERDPEKRLSAAQLLEHPWLKTAADVPDPTEETRLALERLTQSHAEHKFEHAVFTYIAYHADLTEEHDKLAKTFAALDTNGTHTLSREELRAGMAKSGITMSEQDFNALFEKLDTNKNGQINYTEYMAGAMSVNLLANVKVMEDAFKFFDRDNSGAISKAEVKAALKKGWISDVQMAELFQNADTNKDEKISLVEFKKLMQDIAIAAKPKL